MSKIVIATRMVNGAPVLPPFQAEDGGPQLHYDFNKDGMPQAGGWSIIGPYDGKTVLVMVEAPEETITAMRDDLAFLLTDTVDKVKAAAWIVANTDTKDVDLSKEILAPVLAVHGLDKSGYDRLIDTPWAKESTIVDSDPVCVG